MQSKKKTGGRTFKVKYFWSAEVGAISASASYLYLLLLFLISSKSEAFLLQLE